MITLVYFAALAIACLVAVSNWRQAVYFAIVLDFLRDPVRKLDPNESVLITVSILGLWAVITLSAWISSRQQIMLAFRQHPKIFKAIQALALALVPGCALSIMLYPGGHKMVLLGVISYLAPFAGILLGYLIALNPKDIRGLLQTYCIVNGFALIGVVAEFMQMGWPGLGGMKGMEWIRYTDNGIVHMIGGWYRSPDIMGLHAAQVVMFSMTLTIQKPKSERLLWIGLAFFGCVCLLLSGRRKMLGMPFVFISTMVLLSYFRRIIRVQTIAVPLIATALLFGGVFLVATEEYVATEYTNYASTLFSDGVTRYQQLVGGSVAGTIVQSGVMGEGIGTATQGAYHLINKSDQKKFGWQEDGVSRVFRELGIFGVLFVLLAGVLICQALVSAVERVPASWHGSMLQLCLIAIVVANFSSFTISHQQFSGDPPSALLVLLLLGIVLGVTTVSEMRSQQRRKTASNARKSVV